MRSQKSSQDCWWSYAFPSNIWFVLVEILCTSIRMVGGALELQLCSESFCTHFLYTSCLKFRVEFFGEHQPSSAKILLINLSNQHHRALNNLVYSPFAPQMRNSVPTSASPAWSCRWGVCAMQAKGDLKLERDFIKRELLVLGEDIPANEFERSNVLMQIVSRVN